MRIWKRDEDEKMKTTFMHLLHAAFALGGLMKGFFRLLKVLTLIMAQWLDMEALETKNHA